MENPDRGKHHLAIRCDALASLGTGHLVRQSALAEEWLARGHRVSLYGESDVEWARSLVARLGLEFVPAEEDVVAQFTADGVDAVMIDGYDFPRELGRRLRAAGLVVAAMVDGDFGRHQEADLHVDQNLGSEGPGGPNWLVGPRYVLLREVVLDRRGEPRATNSPTRVLVVFGGSDPFGGAPVAVELLLSTGLPVEVVAVAASSERRAAIEALEPGPGQSVVVVPTQDDLPGLALTCDFVVSAAGSSTWEFACLGIPTGLVCVVDNQVAAYEAVTESLAVPIGLLSRLRADAGARDDARAALARLVSDPEHRDSLSEAGRRLVDGEGRRRVADAIERLLDQ